jgi:hypothetical protein
MKRIVLAAAAAFLLSTTCLATIITFHASLSGPAESPPNASPGTGFTTVTLNTLANTLEVAVSFSGLLGTTTASHIHCCTAVPFTGTAMVATTTPTFPGFPLGVTSGTYDATLDLTMASSYNPAFVTANGGSVSTAEATLIAAMLADQTYLNIHTTVVPGGEIRGFLVAPEPSSMVLLGASLLSRLFFRRRKP